MSSGCTDSRRRSREPAPAPPTLIIGLILTLFIISPAGAQTTTGSLTGRVTDEKNQAIAGAVVTVTSPSIQGAKRATTGSDGEYTVPFLPPSADAFVEVEAAGYSKVRFPVQIQPGVVTTRHASLGGTAEALVVSTPMVSPRQTTVPMTIPEEQLDALPILGEFQDRSYQVVLYFTPAATHSRLSGNPAIAGATGIENIYLIDGILTNDPATGTFGTNLNVNFFRELDTEIYGVEAENGTSTGGFFNLITKSGSNAFHGGVAAWMTGRNMTAKERPNDFEITEGRPWEAYDLAFDFGGPILKDRLWFYVGINPYWKTEENVGSTLLGNTVNGSAMAVPFDYDKTWRMTTFLTKFTWRASDRHNLEFVAFGDPARQDLQEGVVPAIYPISSASRRDVGSLNLGLKWYATWSPRFFSEVRLSATERKNDLVPWLSSEAGYGTPLWVSQDWDQDLAISAGFGKFSIDTRRSEQAGFKAVWLPEGGTGHHEVTFGAERDYFSWDQTSGYTGGYMMQVKKQFGPDMLDPASYRDWFVYSVQDPSYEERGGYTALFAQDRWTLVEDLTLTAGIRYEINGLKSQRGTDLSLSSISPRFGLSWDFWGNDRSKLTFSWGRYYERVPLYLAQVLDGGHASFKGTFTNGVRTARAVYNRVPARVLGGVQNQSQDEAVLGIEMEVLPDLVVGARAVYRDLNRLLETVGIYDAATGSIDTLVMNPGHQTTPLLNSWGSVLSDYSAFPKPKRTYRALELLLDKRFSDRWFLQANYTLSRLEGNTAAGYDRGNPELAPNATKEWDIPSAAWIRNRDGFLPTDRTHQLKVFGGYRWDFGLLIGATVRYDMGRPIDEQVDWPKKEVGYGKLYAAPRGSAGRLPSALAISLHAEYTWKIKASTLTVFADLINATNSQPTFRVDETYYEKRSNWDETPVISPTWGKVKSRTEPRAAGFGFKWAF